MRVGFTTINASSLARSVRFYKEILGLEDIGHYSPAPGMNFVFMRGQGGGVLQLSESAREPRVEGSAGGGQALAAIALQVDDLPGLIPVLEANHVEFLGTLIEPRNAGGEPGGIKILFIRDPDGVRIELIQGFDLAGLAKD